MAGGPKPWRAAINVDGDPIELGYYAIEEEAARAFDSAARVYREDYRTILNFPDDRDDGTQEDNDSDSGMLVQVDDSGGEMENASKRPKLSEAKGEQGVNNASTTSSCKAIKVVEI